MDLSASITNIQKRAQEHREVLATEEAAKTALVMPFLQALGYDVFNPAEVVPEFSADVGTKKGEKVDYAICREGKVSILVECKPVSAELGINHASQLFRYFSVTDCRLAILTNGVQYQFYSDIENPNKMDDKPFFTFSLDSSLKAADIKTIERFAKAHFDIEKIVHEAGNLKLQTLIRQELEKEFAEPSAEFARLIAGRIHSGKITAGVTDKFAKLTASSISAYIRDLVTDRLSSALKASGPAEPEPDTQGAPEEAGETTEEEIAGWQIVRAIAARHIDPKRIVIRDQKSYCAILLDDNNRKSIARMHFNGLNVKHFGVFEGKEERRSQIGDVTEIFRFEPAIAARLSELMVNGAGK